MQDPERVYIDDSVELAAGVRIYPGVHLEGSSRVEAGAILGPDVFADRFDHRSRGRESGTRYCARPRLGRGRRSVPTRLFGPARFSSRGAKAGTFVEIKNSQIGEGAKVPHLSYIGDATVGPRANIGAGSITCNYDGFEKHQTVIGEGAFIGSSTMLVAPVVVGPGAFTGAGSVITRNVDAGALAVERSHQQEIAGYAARREERYRAKASED